MLKCKICGREFSTSDSKHYISRDNGETGFAAALSKNMELPIYDTFDCPQCGCQCIAQERKRQSFAYPEYEDEDNEEHA